MLDPSQLLAELRGWLAIAPGLDIHAYRLGRLTFGASDGTVIGHDGTPGYLVLNGTRMYSAAWL